MRIIFVHLLLLLSIVVVVPASAGADPLTYRLPGAIEATDYLRFHMEMMLQRSATFREQCLRLDSPRLRVQIRLDLQLNDRPFRARTTIQRTQDGDILAWVAIAPAGDPTEWLAHELEHVLEQIDGVNLPRLARAQHEAWASAEGAFESTRAIRAGQLVRREVRDGRRAQARAGAIEVAGSVTNAARPGASRETSGRVTR